MIKLDKREKVNLTDPLQIHLCGRVDYDKHQKDGTQNTFWIASELKDGFVTHWHTFGDEQDLHNHNVVVARRKFPVRCVTGKQCNAHFSAFQSKSQESEVTKLP